MKGQAIFEYITIYGIVLAALVIGTMVLFEWGFFEPQEFLDYKCKSNVDDLVCLGVSIDATGSPGEEDSVLISMQNKGDRDYELYTILPHESIEDAENCRSNSPSVLVKDSIWRSTIYDRPIVPAGAYFQLWYICGPWNIQDIRPGQKVHSEPTLRIIDQRTDVKDRLIVFVDGIAGDLQRNIADYSP